MDDEKKQQIATFRFGVIHVLVGHIELEPGEQERLIREKLGWVREDELVIEFVPPGDKPAPPAGQQ